MWALVCKELAPPPPLLTSQCAERFRYLPTEVTTKPGKWKNDNTPYLVEPMDIEQIEPWIDTIYMMKASRTGGTEVINNKLLRKQIYDPGPVLYVQQSDIEARKYSDVILQALIDHCMEFRARLKVNNTLFKKFIGGLMVIAGAQTPKAFRLLEFVWAICDDIDGYPPTAGEEGDIITLAETRTSNATIGRLNAVISSPTLKGYSPIEKLFNTSDQRRWHGPCPICDHEQTFKWGGKEFDFGIKWKKDEPASAYYLCEQCHKKIQHFQKYDMNLRGRWIKTAKPESMNIAGYHFTQVFSNFVPWSTLVQAWLKSFKDPSKLQVFVNTRLGETFEDNVTQVAGDTLMDRLEDYGPKVPVGAWVLTSFTDVQHDRLEAKVCGWGREGECWVLEYKVLQGDTMLPEVWNNLHEYLTAPREHETGMRLKIMASGIDSGYRAKDKVYEFVRPRKNLNIFATKGSSSPNRPVMAERSSKNVYKDSKVHLYEIGTDTAKQSIKLRLLKQEPGPAYIHFYEHPPPGCVQLDEHYFKGLTNAKLMNTSKNPLKPKLEWKKKEVSGHDEQLDCMVGNLAMLNWLMQSTSFDLNKLCDRMERRARAMVAAETSEPEEKAQKKKITRKPKGSWGTDWKK